MDKKKEVLSELQIEMSRVLEFDVTFKQVEDLVVLVLRSCLLAALVFGRWAVPQRLGSFVAHTRRATRRRHPTTGEYVEVPAKQTVVYVEGAALRAYLGRGDSGGRVR